MLAVQEGMHCLPGMRLHPEQKLPRGHVGTVTEILAADVYEVDFCDDQGRTYLSMALAASQLMVLHFQPRIRG